MAFGIMFMARFLVSLFCGTSHADMPFTLHQKLRVAIKMTFISAKTHVGCDTLIPIKTFLNPPKKKNKNIFFTTNFEHFN